MMYGAQPAFIFRVSLGNFEGPRVVGAESIASMIRVRLEARGNEIPVTVEATYAELPDGPFLDPGNRVRMVLSVARADGAELTPGPYTVTIDLHDALNALRGEDDAPWSGRAKRDESRHIDVKEIGSQEDRIASLALEGNYHLGRREHAAALPYVQEWAVLAPASWHSNAALGATLARLNRYSEAVAPLERAFVMWLQLPGPVRPSMVVANELARAYLGLGDGPNAERVLRVAGFPDASIPNHVGRLRTSLRVPYPRSR
jgi:hypothetical protein